MNQIWITLLGIGVGALLGGVISALTSRYAAFKEAKGIAAALHSEIGSILRMIERRQYVEGMMVVIARLTDRAYVPNANDVPSISVTQDYFSVFHRSAAHTSELQSLTNPVFRPVP